MLKFQVLIWFCSGVVGREHLLFTQLNDLVEPISGGLPANDPARGLAGIKESSTVSTLTARRSLTSLKDELETARRQAAMAAGQARC